MSAAWQTPRPRKSAAGADTPIAVGTLGTVTALPAGYTLRSIAVAGAGPTQAVLAAGSRLQTLYGKNASASRAQDPTLKSLGATTDNGAYYYIYTEKGKNYEQTVLDYNTYAKKEKLPYQYMLLDSWWYEQGKGGGVKNWTAQPKVFPDGTEYIQKQTGWVFQGHNRYWAPDNIYAKQNGGDYEFIVETDYAIPVEQRLWDDLIKNATDWGLVTYEQDWLCTEFDGMNATRQNATLGRDWLMQMGRGASKSQVAIQ